MKKYIAWCYEYGQEEEDAHMIDACDGESAAREWSKWYDNEYGKKCAEYEIANGNRTVVTVKEISSGLVEQYSVIGETVRSYSAKKLRKKNEMESDRYLSGDGLHLIPLVVYVTYYGIYPKYEMNKYVVTC
jgi:hypothetical protein